MKYGYLMIYILIILAIAFCWAFDDWCDSQIDIERLKTQQVYYETFGKVSEKAYELSKITSDLADQVIKQKEDK